MKILMCRPDYYGIKYEINPWMDINQTVDHDAALKQWEALYQTIQHCGAQIELVIPAVDWPDMVFTANAGLLYQGKIILSHFKYKERQGELPYFKAWFTQAGFELLNTQQTDDLHFEGAGDALLAGNILFVGYGFRSDQKFYEQTRFFDQSKLIYCELVDPYFYHIDTCFCPLNAELAIWYPPAFSKTTQQKLSQVIKLLPVMEEEAKRFACNAVVIDKHVILPTDCPQISQQLKAHGFIVHPCKMNEYLKAGGACKCLTLRLD